MTLSTREAAIALKRTRGLGRSNLERTLERDYGRDFVVEATGLVPSLKQTEGRSNDKRRDRVRGSGTNGNSSGF